MIFVQRSRSCAMNSASSVGENGGDSRPNGVSFGLPGEAGIAMLLAVDEVMDMARTSINVIGNGLASAVVAKWEHARPIPVAQRPEAIV